MTNFERTYNGRAMRAVKRILDQGRNPPESQDPEMLMAYDCKPGQAKWTSIWLGVVFTLCLFASCAHAYTDDQAIKTVIGEAENQGYIGMLAVAHAIRNRGTLHGCYGSKSFRVRHHLYSQRIYAMARQAWAYSSADYDITHHATGWGNAQDLSAFQKCKWWRNCRVTFMYRDHYFYRRVV